MKILKNFVITLGREYGSGGRAIAEELGRIIGINVFDKNMIEMLAERKYTKQSISEDPDELASDLFFDSYSNWTFDPYSDPYISYDAEAISRSARLFEMQANVIRDAVDEGPAVFVGRCADDILWEYPDVVRVFVFAPKVDRIRRIMEKENITDDVEAEKIIRKMDRARKTYYQFFSDRKWGDSEGMDLLINSSALGIEGSAGLIADYLVRRGYVER